MTTDAAPFPDLGQASGNVPRARPTLTVDNVDTGLLLRTPDDPVAALRLLTRAVVAAHAGQTTVVCSSAVSRRPDLFDVLAQRLGSLGSITTDGVRLVLIGAGPDRETRERGYRELARRLGRPVIGATGPVLVASDGSCAVTNSPITNSPKAGASAANPSAVGASVASAPDAAFGWLHCTADGTVTLQSPWSPTPPWSPMPGLNAPLADGRLVARAVPAGIWLMDRSTAYDQIGAVPNLPRKREAIGIFVGGGGPPVAAADVAAAVAALGLPPTVRVTLLPGGLRPGPLPPTLARVIQGALPAVGPGGWRLVAVTPDGGLTADPTDDHPQWTFIQSAGADRVGTAERTTGWLGPPPGRRTLAGWSFMEGPAVGFTPAAAGPVIEVAAASNGFAVAERTLTPAEFADVVRATVGACPNGLVLIGGPYPAAALIGLSQALGTTIAASTGPVVLTADGALRSSGVFQLWRADGSPRVAGPVLPTVAAGPDPQTLTRIVAAAASAFAEAQATTTDVQTSKRWGWRRRRGADPGQTRPNEPTAGDTADLRPLTLALPDSYRQHLAHVTAVLNSEDSPVPAHRLINEEERERLTTGLVALRAYWSEHRDTVDRWLRGGPDPQGRARILTAWARIGLAQLPVVTGPVFAAVGESYEYEPATEVTEPGFVEAGLAPATFPDDGLDYVIWSVTARRLGRIIHSGEPTAMLAPGARFAVLDVERLGQRRRVFLAESAAGTAPAVPADVLDRLRAAAAAPPSVPVVATGAPIGS